MGLDGFGMDDICGIVGLIRAEQVEAAFDGVPWHGRRGLLIWAFA